MNKQKLAYKKLGNVSLFDNEETLDKLNSLGNPLERLSKVIDFEIFRDELKEGLYKERFTTVGAKPYDYVLMFKVLVLQRMYHLSDEQTEYQIRDRLSFRDFLGLASGDRVPDARTIWVFRKELTEKGLFDALFDKFNQHLRDNNLIMNEGISSTAVLWRCRASATAVRRTSSSKREKETSSGMRKRGTRRMTKNTRPTRSATRTRTRDGRRRAVRSSMATRHMPR